MGVIDDDGGRAATDALHATGRRVQRRKRPQRISECDIAREQHAKDALQAGPSDRDFGEDDVFRELTLPLATNINYLREAPAALFGLAPLAPDRLANPFDWIVASEAYAQLSEESPDHAARISPLRVVETSPDRFTRLSCR